MEKTPELTEIGTGDKADIGKPRMDLISPLAMAYLAQVLTFGANKYAAHNWRKGIPLSKLIAASQRHLTAIAAGIDTDEETGLPHVAHLLCEAMFICEQLVSPLHVSTDDRYQYKESQKNLLVALLAGTVEK